MSISISSPVAAAISYPQSQPSAPAPKAAPQSSPSYPQDTVTLSSTAQKAAPSGDVDRDGDSH